MILEEIDIRDIEKYNFDDEDLKKIVIENGRWAIVKDKDDKDNIILVGLVGILRNKFFEVIIDKKQRGKNYLKKIIDLIIKEWNLKELYATIEKSNKASLKAFSKLGYKQVFEGKIPEGHIRLKIK